MNAVIFDSHQYVQRLVDAGVTPQAAIEHIAKIDELNAKIDRVAAELNAKIDRVAAELNAKIDTLAAECRTYVADAKADVVRWVVSVAILQFALNSALVLKLMH
ncbi:hypothetical protein H3H37_12195 [Duganella sp. LX20W]|uniref:DUF1640 domain-containing protein n=1 Tax=Rugamonas brunnea TaxID=2758569 RepID=A0A7W2IBZ1_9BURK|nr:hypothetical protein [Rugamonas brunnea]MBA5637814.1 hypothetical protein [Rugamonas brunnea]